MIVREQQQQSNDRCYTVELERMGRIRTGFRLLKQSGEVLKKEPSLIVVMAVGFILQIAVFLGLFIVAFQRAPELADFRFPRLLWVFLILAASGMIGSLAGATVIATAMQRLEGRDASIREGFALALDRFPKLVGWTFLSATVGVIIQQLAERLKVGGAIVAAIAGVGWAVATMLVVPVLLFENLGVVDALKRSASLIKDRWGEGVTGYGSVGAAMVVATLPVMIGGAILIPFNPLAGIVLVSATFLGIMLVGGALGGIFSAALYRFAADGTVTRPFEQEQLERSFRTKEEEKRKPALRAMRIAGLVFAGIYIVLKLVQWQMGLGNG